MSALDFFLPVMPTQTLLIACTLLRPARWLRTGLWFTLGGVLGGGALAAVVGTWGPAAVERLIGDATEGAGWNRIQALVQAHGAWALLGLALVPWPVRSAVVVCALAGIPWWLVSLALAGGRLAAFPGLACVVSRSPAWLFRLKFCARIADEVKAIETKRGTGKCAF